MWQSTEPPREHSQLRNSIRIDPIPIAVAPDPPDIYGTRLSTVILVRRDGKVLFMERDVWKTDEGGKTVLAGADPSSERQFRFQLPISPDRSE